ncbi:septum formation initiator family protein [Micromonospora sp. NPDC003197]
MNQRRTPGGQRPARRPGQPGRGGGARSVRTSRDTGVRAEVRGASSRASSTGRGGDTSRSVNRPAVARRVTASGGTKRTSAPYPRRITGRMTVLAAVLIALALAYTYPVRVYLNQEADIARLEAAEKAQRTRIDELSEKAALWRNDDFVKIQAKSRFYMVEPGEKPLVVLFDPEGAARDAGVDPEAWRKPAPDPWYGTLWSSIEAANERPTQ